MRNVEISPSLFIGNPEQRVFLSKVSLYTFTLFCLIPLLAGIILPFAFSLTDQPLASLPMRLVILTATGGASFLIAVLPAFLLLRTRLLKGAYVFLLFPVSVVALVTQWIMYREFGSEIDARLLGLFQGNLPALWSFARTEYHLDWAIGGLTLLSIFLGSWVLRTGRTRWTPRLWPTLLISTLLLSAGSITLAFRPNLERTDLYHPTKLSAAPLFQLLSFVGTHFFLESGSGYTAILERSGAITAEDEFSEITLRLGQSPADFATHEINTPPWLKKRPSHVFFFLMESIEYDLIENPALTKLVPYAKRYSEEGLSVPNFSASSGASIDAIHTFISGVAAQPLYPGASTLTRFDLDSLPTLMARAGYQTRFYVGMHRAFGSKGDVCEAYGFDGFHSCPDLAPELKANEWGVCDGVLYDWAWDHLGPIKTPTFVAYSGVSNHAPYDAPLEVLGDFTVSDAALSRFVAKNREDKIRFAKNIRYADHTMGQMAERLYAAHPDALFVFVGDHGSSKLKLDPLNQVPFVLWNDRIIDTDVDTSQWYGSHMDIPATLANLILPSGETLQTFGRPVWDLSDERISVAGPVSITNHGYLTRKGEIRHRFPHASPETSAEQQERIQHTVLRTSAIEALSWGTLYRKVPRGGPANGY